MALSYPLHKPYQRSSEPFGYAQDRTCFALYQTMMMGVCKCWESERWLSNEVYRNQASGFANNPLGLDTSLGLGTLRYST
jgi:hypothetical protein